VLQLLALSQPPAAGEGVEVLHDGAWWRTRVSEVLRGDDTAAAAAAAAGGGDIAAAAAAGGGCVMIKAPVATINNLVTVPFEVRVKTMET
jgi:hypothetical protein